MYRQLNTDVMKLLNEKINMTAVSSRSTDSGQVVIHAVTQCPLGPMPANINKVEDLTLSQEDKPQKQFTRKNCMLN